MDEPSASFVLEREIGKLLKGDERLKEFFGGEVPFFTYVNEDQPKPYLVYNENRTEPWNADDFRGQQSVVFIELMDAGESEARAKSVMDRIRTLLDWCEKRISLSPYKLVMCNFEVQDFVREQDGQIYRGTAQFRATIGGLPT